MAEIARILTKRLLGLEGGLAAEQMAPRVLPSWAATGRPHDVAWRRDAAQAG
jgi:hypothetical protein